MILYEECIIERGRGYGLTNESYMSVLYLKSARMENDGMDSKKKSNCNFYIDRDTSNLKQTWH